MKKLFSLLFVCVLLTSSAMAETVTWEEVGEPAVAAYELQGDFVALNDMGLALWIPSDMSYMEPSEEDAAAGRYAIFMDNDQECVLTIDAVYVEGITLDQAYENAVANGMTEPEIVNINGIDALTYADETDNSGCVVLVDTNSNIILFSFAPVDSDVGKIGYAVIMSSLMPLE